jgi:Leucine-rich repeat (LRR) protein
MTNGSLLVLLAAAGLSFAADSADWVERLGGRVRRDAENRIVAVNLRGSWINDADEITRLAELPELQTLDLSHTRITDEGLLRLKPAPKIRNLNLFYAEWITDQGMTAIRDWKHLKRLNVRGTRISDGTLELVGKLTGLEALDIAHTAVTDNGLDHLITLVHLKELAMGRGRLTHKSLAVLRMLPTLTSLDISGARPAPPDMAGNRALGPGIPEEALRAMADLKELRVLKLGHSSLTGNGLRNLSVLDQVEKLGLEGCRRIDDAAAAELAKWKSLKYLDLQDTQVTGQGIEALRKAKPGLVVLALPERPPSGTTPVSR